MAGRNPSLIQRITPPAEFMAELERARNMAQHHTENGLTDSIWFTTLARLEAQLAAYSAPEADIIKEL